MIEDLCMGISLLWFFKELYGHEDKDFGHTELIDRQDTDTKVYQGSKKDIVELMNEEFGVGTVHPELGEIVRTSLECTNDGPLWKLRVTFIKPQAAQS